MQHKGGLQIFLDGKQKEPKEKQVQQPKKREKKEKSKEKAKNVEKKIAEKVVKEVKKEVKSSKGQMVMTGRASGMTMDTLLNTKQAWQLSLLRHLHNGHVYKLPSPTFSGLGISDFNFCLFPTFDNFPGIATPDGKVFNAPALAVAPPSRMTNLNNTHTEWMNAQRARDLNYYVVEGVVDSQFTITGNKGVWIWADPTDMVNPIRYSSGPSNQPFWMGDFDSLVGPSSGPYDQIVTGGACNRLQWTSNPYGGIATNYVCNGTQSLYPLDIAPDGPPSINGWPDVRAASFLAYPISSHLKVQVTNNTAYTQTGMRTRGALQGVRRLLNRVEDIGTGYYGLDVPFVKSNNAEAIWSGDSWTFPVRNPVPTSNFTTGGAAPTWPLLGQPPDVAPGTAQFAYNNWCSVQKMLSQDYPVIEILESSPASSDYTISVSVSFHARIAISMIGLAAANGGRGSESTVPFPIPTWYSENRAHGRVIPVEGGGVISRGKVNNTASLRAVAAVPHLDIEHPAVAKLQESPSGVSGFLDKISTVIDKGVGVFEKVKDVLPGAMEAVGPLLGTLFA